MLLPLWISRYWISGLLVQENPFVLHKAFLVRHDYGIEAYKNQLTDKRINTIIEQNIKTKSIADFTRIIIGDDDLQLPNTDIDYRVGELINETNLTTYLLDYTKFENTPKFTTQTRDTYYNYLNYNLVMPFDIRLDIEKQQIENPLKVTNLQDILIITTDFSHFDEDKYIKSLSDKILQNINKPGFYRVTFDNTRAVIPLLAVLKRTKMKWQDYIKTHPLEHDIEYIRAPGLKEMDVGTDKNSAKLTPLNHEKINLIKIKKDEKIFLEFKTKHLSYKGEIEGCKYGLIIDTRDQIENT